MRIILSIIFSFLVVAGNAQEAEMNQLFSINNLSASGTTLDSFCQGIQELSSPKHEMLLNESVRGWISEITQSEPIGESYISKGKSTFETYAVAIITYGGYTFHVADYTDGTHAVSCLDGELRGLQGLAFNGVILFQSTDVEWHSNYFVHRYPWGKVYSYSNKQVSEVKK